jgi:transglutaminase-like putative cysteine protease
VSATRAEDRIRVADAPEERRVETPEVSAGQILWLSLAVLVTGTPHFFFVHPWVPAIVIAITSWRTIAAIKRWQLPGIWLRAPLTFLGFAGVFGSYRQISGLDAGSSLLLVMVAMKLLETRGHRDRAVMVFICYFLLFAAFLREQAIWSAAYLVVGVLVTTGALYQASRSGGVVGVQTAMKEATSIVLQAVPLMVLLFVLFPRIPGPFWALPTAAGGRTTGLSEDMTPGDITSLARSDEVAFRVRFDGALPTQSELYWRGPVMSLFDGRKWSPSRYQPPHRQGADAFETGRGFDYEITLEPHGQRWLLALETPIQWADSRASLSSAFQLARSAPVEQRMAYRARSLAGRATPGSDDPMIRVNATTVPEGRNTRTLAFARDLRSRSGDDATFLAEVLSYFRREPFYYTLSPPALGEDSVDDFLFKTRRGFCGHYASAFAVMARAAGLPARIVTGYQGGERNPFADYWIVRQSDAHAWVEVWLEDRWIRFDPTAAVAPSRIERGFDEAIDWASEPAGRLMRGNSVILNLKLSWDAVNTGWNRWVLSFGPKTQTSLLSAIGIQAPTTRHLVIAMSISVAVFLVAIGMLQRQHHRPRRDPLQIAYRRLCLRTARAGRQKLPWEGPGEYAAEMSTIRPDLAEELQRLFQWYVRLRYDTPESGYADGPLTKRFAAAVNGFRPRSQPAADAL